MNFRVMYIKVIYIFVLVLSFMWFSGKLDFVKILVFFSFMVFVMLNIILFDFSCKMLNRFKY